MAGNAERADKLNYTLNWVVDLFEKHKVLLTGSLDTALSWV